MAGFATQAQLLANISGWKPSRLGNYEAGISSPSASDIRKIAEVTQTSPCWLMFGDGPIRPNERDLQAIRHQNLCHIVNEKKEKRGALARFAKSLSTTLHTLNEYVDNPFKPIRNTMARKFEKAIKQREGWMDEQHVEHDPICQSFPEDIRELMEIYSSLPNKHRQLALQLVRSVSTELSQ